MVEGQWRAKKARMYDEVVGKRGEDPLMKREERTTVRYDALR